MLPLLLVLTGLVATHYNRWAPVLFVVLAFVAYIAGIDVPR